MIEAGDGREDSNRSGNPDIHALSGPARRVVLRGGLGAAAAAAFGSLVGGCAAPVQPSGGGAAGWVARPAAGDLGRLGFEPIPPGSADRVVVPAGYVAEPIAAWGEPVGLPGNMPAWRDDAGNSADEQAAQMGMHHDGLQYVSLDGSRRGLLVSNHEYTDDGLLHPDGVADWSAQKVSKAQAAVGLSVIEIAERAGRWEMVRPSRYARRLTATTPFVLGGPAAGHALMRTVADPQARTVLGTLANCANGLTPWGTVLSGEENFQMYFAAGDAPDAHQRRWGARRSAASRWAEHDERFDARRHPNEMNRFGWIVEIDPLDPDSTPVKRTALGRAAHEGAWVATTRDGRAVVYSGEDASFEYIYKFVSRDRIAPGGAKANHSLLDHGTLFVARFDADGTGRWLPLVHGRGPLTADRGFADQGEVVVKSRQASDALGATRMDRPEWFAIDQANLEVFCTLTNNPERGLPGRPGVDAANPRANNTMGGVIRWQEDGDFDGTTFRWRHLVLAGDPANDRADAQGDVRGDVFACPDGLMLDARGVLWIQTDMGAYRMHSGEYRNMGNNQMLACDLRTGEIRRFLSGPVNCEVTGAAQTPDGRTMFVNIQHPGESSVGRTDPAHPTRHSSWPDGGARPRSATVVIRRRDGGPIGT